MAGHRISVASPQELVPIDRDRMREIVRTVLQEEGSSQAEISVAFVDNRTIQQLNKRYLNHDGPTDILSFPLSNPGDKRLAGELIIGAEVAQTEANNRGYEVETELALYVIHGLLHLCGYDDKSAADAQKMRERERYYLRLFGLPEISP